MAIMKFVGAGLLAMASLAQAVTIDLPIITENTYVSTFQTGGSFNS